MPSTALASATDQRRPTRNVSLLDQDETLPIGLGTLTPNERSELESLTEIVSTASGEITVRRNRRHIVGRCVAAGWTISVPPAFEARLLLQLVLYAHRIDLRVASRRSLVDVSLARASELDLFLQMMAVLLVSEAQEIVATHIAQSYEQQLERSHNPKGRFLWSRDFGRHPGQGVSHTHPVKTTNNALNRLVLAGIRVATAILGDTAATGDANRQAFVWRDLASEMRPRALDYEQAMSSLNRLTAHYRAALVLSRALVSSLTPLDYFAEFGGASLPALQFNLPLIFEGFLERLLSEVGAANSRLAVRAQVPDRRALVDETGGTYRQVRPDLELLIDSVPVAVIDAKFKPYYTSGAGDARRVSNADIYQLLFYQARVAERAGRRVVPAAIVAPQLSAEPLPPSWPREITWRLQDLQPRTVKLLPLALGPVLARLAGGTPWEALDAAPELRAFLYLGWLNPGAPGTPVT